MAQTQLSERYGSSGSIFDTNEKPSVSYSKFNYSMKHNTTLDIGGIYPLDLFEVYPGDRVKLSVRYLLDTLPLAVPPMNNYRIQVHYYHITKNALWKGWDSFSTKGASGLIDKQIPFIPFIGDSSAVNFSSLSSSLSSYLGIPVLHSVSDYTKFPAYLPWQPDLGYSLSSSFLSRLPPFTAGYYFRVNSLPFLFYQKIYRDSYAPIDLCRDSKVWYPDDLSDEWRINYDSSNVFESFFVPVGTPPSSSRVTHTVPNPSDNYVSLLNFRYAQFDTDYFTSAKPWLVRGLETQVQSQVSLGDLGLDYAGDAVFDVTPAFQPTGQIPVGNYAYLSATDNTSASGADQLFAPVGGSAATNNPAARQNFINAFNRSKIDLPALKSSASTTGTVNLTANTLRNLIAVSVWQERNALAHGRYNSLIKAHWGISPKHPDYEPQYLGGTSDMVSFGQVLQTSETTSTSPLGRQAGLGSANGSSYIFDHHFNDYGYVMGVMIISPEVFYSQGLPRMFSDLNFDNQYYPEFARLGFEPILNRELYLQGKTGSGGDDDLFGYTTRSSYLKMRLNRVSGMLSLPPSSDALFSAYSQSRYFTSLPNLSAEFVTMLPQNVRRDFLAYPTLPAFRCQFASDVELIRALPYQSNPETFGF